MARVPMVPEAQVRQSGGPLNVRAPAEAFGASVIGEGMSRLGRAAGAVSDAFAKQAEALAAIDNKINSDAASQRASQRTSDYMIKFQEVNQGDRAKLALPQAFKDLEAIRTEEGAGLLSPAAREMFNSQTRVATSIATQKLAGFVSNEDFRIRNLKIDSNVDNALRGATADNFTEAAAAIGTFVHDKAVVNGWENSPEVVKAYTVDKLGPAAFNIVAGLAPRDPVKAQAFYDAHQDLMNSQQRTQAEAYIRGSVENHTVSAVAAGATEAAIGGAGSWNSAIASIESAGSGGYSAVGPATSKGDHAYGKYQVMGANVGPWTQEVLGRRLTPQEFRADPQAQEAVFNAKFGEYVKKYGSPAEAASVWFTGRTLAGGGATAKDVNGMTGAEYVGRFNAAVGGDPYDNMVANAEREYNAIAADPRLRNPDGTPNQDLINKAQAQFRTDFSQRTAFHNATVYAAQQQLLSTSQSTNITDIKRLTQLPGMMDEWMKMTPKEQVAFTNSLTAEGNRRTPEKDAVFQGIMGLQVTNPQKFLGTVVAGLDLPQSQKDQIFSAQLGMRKKGAMDQFKAASINRALANPLVKKATEALSDDSYNIFTGAMMGELEQWAEGHPGKKPSDAEIAVMANTLLAQRTAKLAQPGIFGGTTFQRPTFEVPEPEARAIIKAFTDAGKTPPSPALIATIYHRAN